LLLQLPLLRLGLEAKLRGSWCHGGGPGLYLRKPITWRWLSAALSADLLEAGGGDSKDRSGIPACGALSSILMQSGVNADVPEPKSALSGNRVPPPP